MGCLLSVVIAAYNAQRVLDTCLESFARLPLDSYEVIVVDDGSTDETFAVAQQFAARHAFARVVHQENGGVSSARNSGMAAAEGDYLFFADADDWVEPDQLAALVKAAAENKNGAMTGFMGMGMAMNAGNGVNAQNLFAMGQQQAAQNGSASPASWKCSCGAMATGKFCPECGSPKPADANGWTCTCGSVNKGKFCPNCGAKKPAGVPQYRCDKCGWEPDDPKNPPKFCPECGDPFNNDDVVQ